MEKFAHIFEEVVDPRRSNATLRDPDGMPMIGPLPALCGCGGCADMERFGRVEKGFPRGFMCLAHGIPSRDAFTNPFNAPDPGGLQWAMLRLAQGRAARVGGRRQGGPHPRDRGRDDDRDPPPHHERQALPAAVPANGAQPSGDREPAVIGCRT